MYRRDSHLDTKAIIETMRYCKMWTKEIFLWTKKKFGLNMQGVCDARGRFLDVTINHPGSTSDYLAWITSALKHKVEQEGFLAPGLALYGDNAYVYVHTIQKCFCWTKR